MIQFNKLSPERMYRTTQKISMPFNMKNRNIDNLVTVLCDDIKETLGLFNSKYVQYIPSYRKYYVTKIERFRVLQRAAIIKNDLKDIRESYIEPSNLPLGGITNAKMIKNMNVIVETSQYFNEVYNDEILARRGIHDRASIRQEMILRKLTEISTLFTMHPNKYLYIPVDKYIEQPKRGDLFTSAKFKDNPVVCICDAIRDNPQLFSMELTDWTFIFKNHNEIFYINAKDVDEKTFPTIVNLFKKFKSTTEKVHEEDTIDDDESAKADVIENENIHSNLKYHLADTNIDDKGLNNIKETIHKEKVNVLSPKEKKVDDNNDKDTTEDIKEENKVHVTTDGHLDEVVASDKVQHAIKLELQDIISPKSTARIAREKKIKEEMKQLTIKGKTIEELKLESRKKSIEPKKIKSSVINPNLKTLKFENFDKDYNAKQLDSDIMNVLTSFSEKDRPLYLIKCDIEDNSTTMDKKYTYKCIYEDEFGKRHNLTFDMPKFINNSFIHLNKSDKQFITQILPMPVTKTGPDTVQVASNYNKIFITRFGQNLSPKITRFNKLTASGIRGLIISRGNNTTANKQFMTTLEYDELATKYSRLSMNGGDLILYFDQNEIRELCDENNLQFNDMTQIPFAIDKRSGKTKLVTIDVDVDRISDTELSPIDYIIDNISLTDSSFKDEYMKLSTGKRYVYTRAKIMAKSIPLGFLLSFLVGMNEMMDRANIKYQFTEKRPQLSADDSLNKAVIQFNDGYLVYDQYPFGNSLLMNGIMAEIPTKEYDFHQFMGKDVYYELFNEIYGRSNLGNAIENFDQLFIDPITNEVLEDNHLPTEFTNLMIYANKLLENNAYDEEHMRNYRIRRNEMAVAHMYKALATAYEEYRLTADAKNPHKFQIRPNAIINDLMSSQVFEESSTINPIFEIERLRSTSPKGLGGCNLDRAFSLSKRSFNPSMMGILGQSSPVSANIGISRVMSIDPKVTSTRGYLEPGEPGKLDKLNSINICSGAELLVPFAPTKDDPQRVSMASIQSRHTVSCIDSDVPLFGTGFDKVLAHVISDKFAFKAKQAGKITEINNKLGYMMIEYVDGSKDVVDLSNRQDKNAGGGFYISNKLSPNKNVGDRFDEGEVIARNDDFFNYDDTHGDTVYKAGPLARVAIMHSSSTFEDSTIITENLAQRMSTYITHEKNITIGKNSNIYHIVKVGDKVKVGDPLLVFDESYEDDYLNKLLAKMNEDVVEDIIEGGRTPIKSKYNGEIVGVEIYYTVPKDELSESLNDVINVYEKDVKKREKVLKSAGIDIKDITYMSQKAEMTKPVNGKIKGTKMDGSHVFIEFKIKELDKFGVGDKL